MNNVIGRGNRENHIYVYLKLFTVFVNVIVNHGPIFWIFSDVGLKLKV